MRIFKGGATRDIDKGKLDYEACLSPLVLERYAQYLYGCQEMPDGSRRADDNWQKGIPLDVYMKSAWRHFFSWWKLHRGWGHIDHSNPEDLEEALCALMFNVMGYLHEHLKVEGVAEVGLPIPHENAGSPKAPDRSEEEHGT